jgi:mRNA interferase RelE/StbE
VGTYRIEIKRSARRELENIAGKKLRQRIVDRIASLASDPRPPGAIKLSATRNKYRIREGDFRILYEIEDDVLKVYVVKIADRKDVYRR